MGLFSKIENEKLQAELKQAQHDVRNLKAGNRMQRGKLKAELDRKDDLIAELESRLESSDAENERLLEKVDYFQSQEVDVHWIEQEKRKLKVRADDIKEHEDFLANREKKLRANRAALEEDENQEYKKGYADGLADGLRKAHEITREDRKMMTMIAMSTNQGAAINEAAKISRQLEEPTDAKSDKPAKK